ncbi:unnamed protein product [Rhizopus microsporus]
MPITNTSIRATITGIPNLGQLFRVNIKRHVPLCSLYSTKSAVEPIRNVYSVAQQASIMENAVQKWYALFLQPLTWLCVPTTGPLKEKLLQSSLKEQHWTGISLG